MIMDDLGLLRGDGSAPGVSATEAGSVSLTRDATTGKVVLDIRKTGKDGLPIVCITGDDGGTSTDKTLTLTIEAADELAFDTTDETVATFPAVSHGDTGTLMVRRIHTQKQYIRTVITAAGSDGTIDVDFLVFVGHELMNVG
ncbi:MAG: hypothetical protein ACWGQW_00295 [bacterium]